MDVTELHQRLVALKRLAAGENCGLFIGVDDLGLEVKITDRSRTGIVYSRLVHVSDVENDVLNPTVIELVSECRRERTKARRERENINDNQSQSSTA
jgi:hypothetical protein